MLAIGVSVADVVGARGAKGQVIDVLDWRLLCEESFNGGWEVVAVIDVILIPSHGP